MCQELSDLFFTYISRISYIYRYCTISCPLQFNIFFIFSKWAKLFLICTREYVPPFAGLTHVFKTIFCADCRVTAEIFWCQGKEKATIIILELDPVKIWHKIGCNFFQNHSTLPFTMKKRMANFEGFSQILKKQSGEKILGCVYTCPHNLNTWKPPYLKKKLHFCIVYFQTLWPKTKKFAITRSKISRHCAILFYWWHVWYTQSLVWSSAPTTCPTTLGQLLIFNVIAASHLDLAPTALRSDESPAGAQEESFKQKKCRKFRDTVPLSQKK